MSSTNKDEARKEVNTAISNSSASDISRMMDAAKSSREKREQSKREREAREREAREAAALERENSVCEPNTILKTNTDHPFTIRVVVRMPLARYTNYKPESGQGVLYRFGYHVNLYLELMIDFYSKKGLMSSLITTASACTSQSLSYCSFDCLSLGILRMCIAEFLIQSYVCVPLISYRYFYFSPS